MCVCTCCVCVCVGGGLVSRHVVSCTANFVTLGNLRNYHFRGWEHWKERTGFPWADNWPSTLAAPSPPPRHCAPAHLTTVSTFSTLAEVRQAVIITNLKHYIPTIVWWNIGKLFVPLKHFYHLSFEKLKKKRSCSEKLKNVCEFIWTTSVYNKCKTASVFKLSAAT